MIMDSAKNGRWIIPFKKFGRLMDKDIKTNWNAMLGKKTFQVADPCVTYYNTRQPIKTYSLQTLCNFGKVSELGL